MSDKNIRAFTEKSEFLEAQDDGTVKQVVIRAGMSKNNRIYPAETLRNAVPLFNNAQTFADHELWDETVTKTSGWLTDVEYDEGMKAITATRHFSDNSVGQDMRKIVMQIVEGDAPESLMGSSINALGTGDYDEEGNLVVEAFTKILSVDDVTKPAAGGKWQKLVASEDLLAELMTDISYERWQEIAPKDHIEKLRNELKAVRQTEAMTALEEEIKDLKADNTKLREARESADKARRETAVALRGSKLDLPKAWHDALMAELMQAKEDEWDAIVEREQAKYESTGAGDRAGHEMSKQRQAPEVEELAPKTIAPQLGETLSQFDRRKRRMRNG